ncbi:23 kDa integral membrane protein-like [Epargyreus clarus]|uniref:23 kDa integral membrane protein-like n=1 Tax=Epargyreus clarus TaxID=520877 RepID=UPI003C30D0BC
MSGSNCCRDFLKYTVILFNFLISIAGIGLAGYGGYFLMYEKYSEVVKTICFAIIAISVISMIISFAGCYGAMKSSCFMLAVYIFLLVVLVIGNICAIVYLYDNTNLMPESKNVFDKILAKGACEVFGWLKETDECMSMNKNIDIIKYMCFSLLTFKVLAISLASCLACFDTSREKNKRNTFTMAPHGFRQA